MFVKGLLPITLAVMFFLNLSQDDSKKGHFETTLNFKVLKTKEGHSTLQKAINSLEQFKTPEEINEKTKPMISIGFLLTFQIIIGELIQAKHRT